MEYPRRKLFTYDDYLLLKDDGKRYEIIEGELSMAPAPFTDHQRISIILTDLLYQYTLNKRLGEVFAAPTDVLFTMTDIVQPDIIFVSRERKEIITKKNIIAAPDLIIEILSPSSALADRTTKKALYEKYGVKEYWIVDPDEETIELFILEENIFVTAGQYKNGEMLTSKLLPCLEVELEKVFKRE